MPIHLITGIPGHGKTAQLIKLLLEANADNAKLVAAGKSPRPLYAAGVDGLEDGLAEPLDDPTTWCRRDQIGTNAEGKPVWEYKSNLPSGALIFVDEAWKWFGHLQGSTRDTPTHVLGLAEHRHFGIDFVWTAQGVGQMYPFLRPLVSPHWHTVRKFGTQQIDLYKWEELCEDVKSQASRDRANKVVTVLPTQSFGKYKSASEHTIKPRLPWKIWAIPVCFALAIVCAYYVYQGLRPDAIAAIGSKGAESGLPDDAPEGPLGIRSKAAATDEPMTAQAWLDRLLPRFPGIHGSAPAFDAREVVSVPRRFCVVSGEGSDARCGCYTEQVTPLPDVPPTVCLHVARWGEYDPFRGELEVGQPHEVFKPDPASPGLAGAESPPSVVGHPRQGGIQGRDP